MIANRYEPEGHFTFEQLGAVETLGAKIGHAIIEQFPEPDTPSAAGRRGFQRQERQEPTPSHRVRTARFLDGGLDDG